MAVQHLNVPMVTDYSNISSSFNTVAKKVNEVIDNLGGGGGGGVQVWSGVLNPAALIAGNPIPIIPAPGVGKIIVPLTIFINFIPNTTPYDVSAYLCYPGLSGNYALENNMIQLYNQSTPYYGMNCCKFTNTGLYSDVSNKPLCIVPGAAGTKGDATVCITVTYIVTSWAGN